MINTHITAEEPPGPAVVTVTVPLKHGPAGVGLGVTTPKSKGVSARAGSPAGGETLVMTSGPKS